MSKNNTKALIQIENSLSPEENLDLNRFLADWYNDDTYIKLLTSGSTGARKEIAAEKMYMRKSAQLTGAFFGFHEQTKVLHCLPLTFIAGKMMLVRILEFGMPAVFTAPKDPLGFSDRLEIDFAAMTPYQYAKCFKQNREKLARIKTVLLGGAAISQSLEEEIESMPHRVFHSYGMTETYSHVALKEIGKTNYFRALQNISFHSDENNALIIEAPDLNARNLQTNDAVRLKNPFEFEYLGRLDFVINSGGIKLFPEEIEQKLSSLMGSVNFFIAGVSDGQFGSVPALFVEDENFQIPQSWPESLTRYEVPKKIVRCANFSYTQTGKLNRIETQKRYAL